MNPRTNVKPIFSSTRCLINLTRKRTFLLIGVIIGLLLVFSYREEISETFEHRHLYQFNDPFSKETYQVNHISAKRIQSIVIALKDGDKYMKSQSPMREAVKRFEICKRYMNESQTTKQIYRSVWTSSSTVSINDITLVTVMSLEKFHILKRILDHWPGPISVAVLVGYNGSAAFIKSIMSPELLRRENIELSIIAGDYEFIPINWLRQVAIEQVKTRLVFLTDVDLVPSFTLYENLLEVRELYKSKRMALVIPAFEFLKTDFQNTFPENKSTLLSLWKNGGVGQFRFKPFWPGYGPTDYGKWKKANQTYRIKYQRYFEPFIFVDKTLLPKYDVRFHGRFLNKDILFCTMNKQGYVFDVMPSDFCIHYIHARSKEAFKHEKCSRALKHNC